MDFSKCLYEPYKTLQSYAGHTGYSNIHLEPQLKILISKAQFKHVVKKSNNKNYEGGHKDDRSNGKKKQDTLFQGKEMDHGILVQDEP